MNRWTEYGQGCPLPVSPDPCEHGLLIRLGLVKLLFVTVEVVPINTSIILHSHLSRPRLFKLLFAAEEHAQRFVVFAFAFLFIWLEAGQRPRF